MSVLAFPFGDVLYGSIAFSAPPFKFLDTGQVVLRSVVEVVELVPHIRAKLGQRVPHGFLPLGDRRERGRTSGSSLRSNQS